jgi:Zn-finger nucleic acid-binding protein
VSYRENAIFCPACSAAMEERSTVDALIDVCPECGGIYLDWFDGEPTAALQGWAPTHDPNQAPIQSLKGVCPKCGGGLVGEELPGTGAIIFRCVGCAGFFATEPAAKMIAGHTEPLPSDAPGFFSQLVLLMRSIFHA